MNILILCDSFKGTFSSKQIETILRQEILKRFPSFKIDCLPFSDGGEECLDCFETALTNSKRISLSVTSSFQGEKTIAHYLIHKNEAIIEASQAMGLYKTKNPDPCLTTTYGVGEMIKDASKKGCSSFVITLGGSSTNDGGSGMLSALGLKFLNKKKQIFLPTGGTLIDIENILEAKEFSSYKKYKFKLLCDVKNKLLGQTGATYTFAKQKGARDLEFLEENMKHFSSMIDDYTKSSISMTESSGACGGLSYGFLSFFDCQITSGAEEILSLYKIDSMLDNYNLIITGEGKTDSTSFYGKAISIIGKKALKRKIPVLLISGYIDDNIREKLSTIGIEYYISIQDAKKDLDTIKKTAEKDLRKAAQTNLCSILSKF